MKKIFLYFISLVFLIFLATSVSSVKSSTVQGSVWLLINDTGRATVPLNSQITLQWGGDYIRSCEASGGWTGSVDPSGTKTLTVNSDKDYLITCYDYSSDRYITAQASVDVIVCGDYTDMSVCLNDTLGQCNWENKRCIPLEQSQQTEMHSSVRVEPVLSIGAILSGTQLKISGTFTGGVGWAPTSYCYLFEPESVTYQIDSGAKNNLNCWGLKTSGANGSSVCSSGYCHLCNNSTACKQANCLWSDSSDKCSFGTAAPSCPGFTSSTYAFSNDCFIDVSSLTKTRHTLKITVDYPVTSKTFTKTFTMGSSSSGGGGSSTTETSTPTPTVYTPPTVTPIVYQDLSISNYVHNASGTSSWYATNTSAKPGETVSFLLKVANTGNTSVDSVIVNGDLPNKLTLQSGTLKVDGATTSGSLSAGLNLGTLSAGTYKQITFDAVVADSGQFTVGSTESLTYSASVLGVGVIKENDSSTVRVGLSATKGLSLIYTVKDVTSGSDYTSYPEVAPGDTLQFKLEVGSTGNAALENAGVRVNGSNVFEYVSGSTKVDGAIVSDGIMDEGIDLGTISAGKNKTVIFTAKVSTNYDYDVGDNFFENSARAYATGLSQYDSVEVNVVKSSTASLSIVLSGKNISNDQSFYTSYVSAYPGQTISFVAEIEALGNEDISNVTIKDVLPSRLKYLTGSTTVDGIEVEDGIASSGINIGDIFSGDKVEVAFNAEVSPTSSFSYGKTTLWNKITASGSGVTGSQSLGVYVFRTNPTEADDPTKELLVYNETKNQDATMILADPGDVIAFYLFSKNNNSIVVDDYIVRADLSGALGLSSLTYNGGGVVSGNEISYPASPIAVGGTISKEFKIKVKEASEWGDANQIVVSYGNEALINLGRQIIIPDPQMELVMGVLNLTSTSGSDETLSLINSALAQEYEVKATSNDKLQIKVDVKNTGLVAVGNVRVVENLPDKMNYISSNENGVYNSLTSEIIWDLGVLLPDETKTLTLLASIAEDVFVPSNFTLEARAEASTGIKDLTISSNPVKAIIKNFINPYANLIKLLIASVGLIVIGILVFILIKKRKRGKNNDSNEFAVV